MVAAGPWQERGVRVGGCSAWQGILRLTCASGLVSVVCSSLHQCDEDTDNLRGTAWSWCPAVSQGIGISLCPVCFVLCCGGEPRVMVLGLTESRWLKFLLHGTLPKCFELHLYQGTLFAPKTCSRDPPSSGRAVKSPKGKYAY